LQPSECQALIEKLRTCRQDELLEELKKIDTWVFGKCELYHWIEILDVCDAILEQATKRENPNSWVLACDVADNDQVRNAYRFLSAFIINLCCYCVYISIIIYYYV
jgi:E3 ubiquitin-protein ligase HUWE1